MNKFVSSANFLMFSPGTALLKCHLHIIRNKSGPKNDPCETPQLMYGTLSQSNWDNTSILSSITKINVKNFHGNLTTVVRAQNDTTKTANITDTIFDRTLV